MGQDCERFIGMSLEAVKDADAIVYCDGGSKPEFWICANWMKWKNLKVIANKYNQEDKSMNGKQRNFYLDYVKKNYSGWWCLAIDADEVVEDLSKIKYFINTLPKGQDSNLYSMKMRHLIGDLAHEDATQQVHFVQHRLFKIRDDLYYPEIEHSVLNSHNDKVLSGNIQPTTIWHLAYIPNLFEYKKKYDNHMKKSDMHTPEFLKQWYWLHIFGEYPRTKFNPMELPDVLLKEFGIDKDELYFMNRKLETKHFLMSKQWIKAFDPITVLDLGCGLGHYGYAMTTMYEDIEYLGIEKSMWAKNNSYKELDIRQGQIQIPQSYIKEEYNLVLCIDILEHLKEEDLEKSLVNIKNYGKNFIFSIPFLGDPNLEADPTHIIKKTKKWWVDKLSKYFKIEDAPEDWLYHEQMLLGKKK